MASKRAEQRISPVDVRIRVVALALEPALSLARILALPLDDLHRLVDGGYFREVRSRGLSLPQIARRFGKSLRTVATLSQRARQDGTLLSGSDDIRRRRRLVAWLGRHGGATRAAARRHLGESDEQLVHDALDQLVAEGILTEHEGQVRVAAAHMDLLRSDIEHRLDSLSHFLTAVTHVIYRRFFLPPQRGEAFARVLTFSASPERLATLSEQTYARLKDEVVAVDAEATANGGSALASAVLGVVEIPHDVWWR